MKGNSMNINLMVLVQKSLSLKTTNTQETLETISNRVTAGLTMTMAAVIKVFGKVENSMAKAIISVKQWSIKGDGSKINFMDMEGLYGRMEECMKAIISMAKRKEKELTHTLMAKSTLENGH